MNQAETLDIEAPATADGPFGLEQIVDLAAYHAALANGANGKKTRAALLKEGRANARAIFEQRKFAGIEAGNALRELQDFIIREMFDAACRAFPLPHPTVSERLAVVAVGGYGRGLLAPGSDIDLLFLTPYKRTPWVETIVETMLYELWDLRQKVGQATRSIDECLRLAGSDMTIRTSLLETRLISGDSPLYDEMRDRLRNELFSSTAAEFAQAKLGERHARHEQAGDSRYLLEPNIKEGKGALRDLHSLFWIAKYTYHVDNTDELVQRGVFTVGESRRFAAAERFLWSVRFWLHYLSKRAQEQLTFDKQIEIAERMGFAGDEGQSAVERFMMRYFTVAKEVGDLTRIFCAALEAQQIAPKRKGGWRVLGLLSTRSDAPEVALEHGRILIEDPEFFRAAPIEILRVFLSAAKSKVTIHPTTLKLIRRNLGLIDDTLRTNAEANEVFLEILCDTKDPEKALRLMNETGVLGRFVPEFGQIVCMMQFNMYHHYTVDEHTIRAVGNLAALERDKLKDEARVATALMKGTLNRRILYVAVLLHDIGKGRPEDHSELGARISAEVCPRLGLSEQETERVVWLVRHHLLMSDVAQKRDLSDIRTIRGFSDVVQSLELLNMLMILTVCDIRAVGPGTWNGWKAQLLRTLFHETRALISGGHHGLSESRAERVKVAQEVLRAGLEDWDEAEIERFLSRHYAPYWLALDASTHEIHARMLRGADTDKLILDASGDTERGVTRLAVAMGDHPGLFSRITGAVSLAGASIVEARTFTTSDGLAIATIWLQDEDGEAYDDPDRLRRLERTVRRVMGGEIMPHQAFKEREDNRLVDRERHFTVPPSVTFDNTASELYTVVEVTGRDRMGLVHDLSRAISMQRVNIFSAVIATYGERAVDTFYVKDLFGHKIENEKHRKAIEIALFDALEGNAQPAA